MFLFDYADIWCEGMVLSLRIDETKLRRGGNLLMVMVEHQNKYRLTPIILPCQQKWQCCEIW